jgi:hypothetical protein
MALQLIDRRHLPFGVTVILAQIAHHSAGEVH